MKIIDDIFLQILDFIKKFGIREQFVEDELEEKKG